MIKIKVNILIISVIVFFVICFLLSLYLLNNKFNHTIIYQNSIGEYNIHKSINKIEVSYEMQPFCIKAPCDPVEVNTKINFSDDNMLILNKFIESLFENTSSSKLEIKESDLNTEELQIMNSIIYNDEKLLQN